jgi:hypothetical protein
MEMTMLKKYYIYSILLCLLSSPIQADDLNDGITADDPINDDLQIDKNIEFIKRNAIAKSLRAKDKDNGCGGSGNQTFGPGTNLSNTTIINLSNNENSNAVCIKR